MADTRTLIERAYAASNERNVGGAMHQKRTTRKSGSGGLCFTVFTNIWRFMRGQPLPAATVGNETNPVPIANLAA